MREARGNKSSVSPAFRGMGCRGTARRAHFGFGMPNPYPCRRGAEPSAWAGKIPPYRLGVILFLIALVLILPFSTSAQGPGVRIENFSPSQVDTEPGQIVVATFRIWNETDAEREFSAAAELPTGWVLVSPLFPFTLKPAEEKFLFVGVALPKYELARMYVVSVKVTDTSFAGITDEGEVEVKVIPVAKVEVRAPPGEYRLLAGDEYTRTFTVLNQSNAPSRFKIDLTSRPEWEATAEPMEFSLVAGSSQPVVVTVRTPRDIEREERHRVTLTARSLDLNHGTVEAKATVTTIVYPRLLVGDMYETLDGDYSFLLSWEEDETIAAQFKLDLKGDLGEGRWGEVYFVGPYPSRWRGQRFLQTDRFHIEYGDESKGYVSLGDDSLEVTPLTERYFYGRGIDLEVRKDPVAFRVFASKRGNAWIPERLTGAQISVEAPGNTEVALTALRKEETQVPSYLTRGRQDGKMLSLSATSNPAEGVELEGEYGWGNFDDGKGGGSKSDTAYRLAANVNHERFYFDGELVRAGAYFPGYWQDVKHSRAHLSTSVARGIRIWGSFSQSERNLEGDPLKARPKNSNRSVGMSIDAGPLGRASIYQRWSRREDTNLLQWNERDRTTNFQLSRSFGDLSLTGTAEFGKRQNRLTGTERDLERYRLMFNARPGRHSTFSGGYSWDVEDTALGAQRLKSNQLWFNADVRLSKRTKLSASYSRTDGSGRPSYNWLRAELEHDLGSDRALHIRIQRRGGALGSELAAGLELTFPLSVPVLWLPKSGRLEGRVYANEGREEPLEGVVILVDGMKVATDGGGRFVFPALAAGEYEMTIDRGTLGLDRIPDLSAPFSFSVKPGETVKLDIPIVHGATVNGRVTTALWTSGNDNNRNHVINGNPDGQNEGSVSLESLGNGNHNGNRSGYRNSNAPDSVPLESLGGRNGNNNSNGNGNGANGASVVVGVTGVLVVLENGEERFVRITDLNGEFSFCELRPGRWKLTLAEGQMPKYYELVPLDFEIDLMPGQTDDTIEFLISPVARPVVITTQDGNQTTLQ